MKKAFIIILLSATSLVASAQLQVTSDGKVKIASNSNATNANLQVGNNSFGGNASNIGISGHTSPLNGKNNIGVAGRISANSNFSNDSNYGVLGIVQSMNY